jgi:hypothetical protein
MPLTNDCCSIAVREHKFLVRMMRCMLLLGGAALVALASPPYPHAEVVYVITLLLDSIVGGYTSGGRKRTGDRE